MTITVVPTNGPWAANLVIPADGETINSASVLQYVQELANRLEFLRQRTPGANPSSNILQIGRPAGEATLLPGSVIWEKSFSATASPVVNNLALSTQVFLCPIPLVAGQVIRSFSAVARGAGGHAALPAVMPLVELVKLDVAAYVASNTAASPAYTAVDSQIDPSVSTAAYQIAHSISKTLGAPQTVGASEQWALRLTGESGANALIGMQWVNFSIGVSA